MVGAKRDPAWGTVLLLGLGGIWVEALGDVQLLPVDARRGAHLEFSTTSTLELTCRNLAVTMYRSKPVVSRMPAQAASGETIDDPATEGLSTMMNRRQFVSAAAAGAAMLARIPNALAADLRV